MAAVWRKGRFPSCIAHLIRRISPCCSQRIMVTALRRCLATPVLHYAPRPCTPRWEKWVKGQKVTSAPHHHHCQCMRIWTSDLNETEICISSSRIICATVCHNKLGKRSNSPIGSPLCGSRQAPRLVRTRKHFARGNARLWDRLQANFSTMVLRFKWHSIALALHTAKVPMHARDEVLFCS